MQGVPCILLQTWSLSKQPGCHTTAATLQQVCFHVVDAMHEVKSIPCTFEYLDIAPKHAVQPSQCCQEAGPNIMAGPRLSHLQDSGDPAAPSWSRPGILMELASVQGLHFSAEVVLGLPDHGLKAPPHAASKAHSACMICVLLA